MSTRPVSVADAVALAALRTANQEFTTPYDPVRSEEFFTEARQARLIADLVRAAGEGRTLPRVILDDTEATAGCITLSVVEHGPYRTARVGYWVAEHSGGRASPPPLAEVLALAFGDLGLRRAEAATLVDNRRSQAVLAGSGFIRIGFAPRYLMIPGRRQDHLLFQRLADD